MDEADARRVATSVLRARFREFDSGDWVVTGVAEYESAWAVNYNTRVYAETGEASHALAGNGALVVPKTGEDPWFTWSGGDTASQVARGYPALWDVALTEISAGVYRCVATDTAGRSVGASGDDPDALVTRCVADLKRMGDA